MELTSQISEKKTLKVSEIFYLLFWFLKPFYLRESGTFQIADAMLVLSFLTLLVENRWKITVHKEDRILYVFVGFTIIINTTYFFIYSEVSFLLAWLYYVFNLFGVVVARRILNRRVSRERLLKVSVFGLCIQLLIYLVGVGNYEGARYIGSFNDPNQFGFYVLSTYFLILIIAYCDRLIGRKVILVITAITIFLVIRSVSMAMLSALIIFGLVLYVLEIFEPYTTVTSRIVGLIMLLVGILVTVLVLTNISTIIDFMSQSKILNLRRISDKIGLLFGQTVGNYSSIKEDRNWQLLGFYPRYMLYGAGQAYYERFTKVRIVHEVHSTWLGILFSYGIVPTVFFIKWVLRNLKGLPRKLWCIYIAFFFEALMLVNQRQPAFWLLIVMANIVITYDENMKERKLDG